MSNAGIVTLHTAAMLFRGQKGVVDEEGWSAYCGMDRDRDNGPYRSYVIVFLVFFLIINTTPFASGLIHIRVGCQGKYAFEMIPDCSRSLIHGFCNLAYLPQRGCQSERGSKVKRVCSDPSGRMI